MTKQTSEPQFRDHQQMSDLYQTLAERGQAEKPYILEYEKPGQRLIFFGSIHSADPRHEQVRQLDEKWQEFLDHENTKKHVFSEGNLRPVDGKTKERAIISDAESGHICWLAQRDGISISSPEPDRAEEIDNLHNKGFSYEDIITYYFARQMLQWLNYDHVNRPDWREYASKVGLYKTVHDFGGLELNLDSMLEIYEKQTNKAFDPQDRQMLYDLSDPGQNTVSSASGRFRDQRLFAAIKAKWEEGFDVFSIYGSGHAIVLEPALENLTGGLHD